MTRLEKAGRARELRDQGLLLREIGERMGAAKSTVNAWLTDPDGSKDRARKDGYRGTCEDCGGQTDGSGGAAAAPSRCIGCIRWTRGEILAALRRWADEHGSPPRLRDLRSAESGYPSHDTVMRCFGRWNYALQAAGLPLRMDKTPETQEQIVRWVREGLSTAEVARRHGVTPRAIRMRFTTRGQRIADVRNGVAA